MSCKDCKCEDKKGCSCFGNGVVIPNGPDGENGLSAYEIAVLNGFVGDESAWLASLVGPTGATGATGATGEPGAPGECDCLTVYYNEARSYVVQETLQEMPSTSFVISQNGDYEILVVCHASFAGASELTMSTRLNGTEVSLSSQRKAAVPTEGFIIPITVFHSSITASIGDTLSVYAQKTGVSTVTASEIITKISKI